MKRFAYIALIVVLTGIVLLFKFRNLDMVSVSLLSATITLPISILVIIVYVLGMLTGSLVFSLLRTSVREATRRG